MPARPSREARASQGANITATGFPVRAPHCACGGACPRCTDLPAPGKARPSVDRVTQRAGQPLPRPIRTPFEQRMGADLSGVRIHTDQEAALAAAAIDANAFTRGAHVVFGRGRFAPHTTAGAALLAHELAHVLQQTGGGSAGAPLDEATDLEREARGAAVALATGRGVSIVRRPEARGRIQRDGPASGPASPQLTLDPEIEAEMARLRFQLWLAQQTGTGSASAPAGTDASAEPVDAAQNATPVSPVQPIPLPGNWLGPSRLGAEALDFGALLTPYFNRGLLPNAFGDERDVGVISRIFADRYALVSRLPDVRLFVPGFARSWIPTTWRVDLASALTSTTVDWALSGQHPTVFDVSNRSWELFTGATTYSTPMLKVPYLSNWWDQFSSGTPGRSR